MAGKSAGDNAGKVFCENLEFACRLAAKHKITVLIEPINSKDVPGYFLSTPEHARKIVRNVAAENLKIMFDCYHIGKSGFDVVQELRRTLPLIGHVQFAGTPDRHSPDQSELDYDIVFSALDQFGYQNPLGAEYLSIDNHTFEST